MTCTIINNTPNVICRGTDTLTNLQTYKLTNLQTYKLTNLQTYKLTHKYLVNFQG